MMRVLLLAISLIALAPAAASAQTAGVSAQAASAEAQETVLAHAREEVPVGEVRFRLTHPALPAHASGFDYATRPGIAVGRATWIGAMQEHTHAEPGPGMRRWFVSAGPASTRGAAPTRPHDQVLSEIRLPRPGDAVGPLGRRGPVGVALVDGQVNLGGRTLPSKGVTVVPPEDRDAFTNTGPGPARFLVLAVTPVGAAPDQLPRSGGPIAQLPVALATATAALSALGLSLRRRNAGDPHTRNPRS